MPPIIRTTGQPAGFVVLTVSGDRRVWHLPYGWPNAGALPVPGQAAATLCEIGEPIRGAMSTSDLLLADLLTGAVPCEECAGVLRTRHEAHDLSTLVAWRKPKESGDAGD